MVTLTLHPSAMHAFEWCLTDCAGAYSSAAWAARQVEREAVELAAPDAPPPDATVAALHAVFAERQTGLLQVHDSHSSCPAVAATAVFRWSPSRPWCLRTLPKLRRIVRRSAWCRWTPDSLS